MKFLKVSLVAIAVAGIVLALRSESVNSNSNGNQEGRYRLIVCSDSTSMREFVIDTQSGRVWRYIVNKEQGKMVFYPCMFQSFSNEFSLVPNENETRLLPKDAGARGALDDIQTKMKEDENRLFPDSKPK